MSNSLALLADAGHVLTDAGALGLSLFVAWLARQPGAPAKTYGYLRWEILAALINGATLLLISVWIVIEAVIRCEASILTGAKRPPSERQRAPSRDITASKTKQRTVSRALRGSRKRKERIVSLR